MIKLIFFLIGFATVCAVILWTVAWLIGASNLVQDYILDFEILKRTINEYKVTPRNKAVIENKFDAIERYRCRDEKRLGDLKWEFYKKFNLKESGL